MATDSRLQSLQKDLENLQKAQTAITEDIRSLRKTMEDKVNRIKLDSEDKIKRMQTDYGNDILSLERKYDGNTRRMPDVNRQIEARQAELEREQQRNATSSGVKKTGW